LRNRKKPISIAARAIIRAGKGHRYWSSFDNVTASKIEAIAGDLHTILFDPEIKRPIKTLDLPLGGPKGVRTALHALIDLTLIATRNQQGLPKRINDTNDDFDGIGTISVLNKTLALAKKVTGNDGGSLGLHPAVYFYGPNGRHSGPMFMGTMVLVGKKLSNNDKKFFENFTSVRSKLENILIENKDLIATILQKHGSLNRVDKYATLLGVLIDTLIINKTISESDLVDMSGLNGKIVVGSSTDVPKDFSDDTKSQAFINIALSSSIKCPICGGYLDTEKAVSYDHVVRARDGGGGNLENCNLTHPYCNQSIKQ
jgi:HNH endonuclease